MAKAKKAAPKTTVSKSAAKKTTTKKASTVEDKGVNDEVQENGQKAAPHVQLLSTFVKDISFENIAAQNGITINQTPRFEMNLNIVNKKIADEVFEVALNIKIKATENDQTIFILDLDHAGRFHIQNVEEPAMVPLLYIECPRTLFPYTRRIVSTTTMDGGLMPLNLEPIDFVEMFQNSVRAAQEKQAAENKAKEPVEQ